MKSISEVMRNKECCCKHHAGANICPDCPKHGPVKAINDSQVITAFAAAFAHSIDKKTNADNT